MNILNKLLHKMPVTPQAPSHHSGEMHGRWISDARELYRNGELTKLKDFANSHLDVPKLKTVRDELEGYEARKGVYANHFSAMQNVRRTDLQLKNFEALNLPEAIEEINTTFDSYAPYLLSLLSRLDNVERFKMLIEQAIRSNEEMRIPFSLAITYLRKIEKALQIEETVAWNQALENHMSSIKAKVEKLAIGESLYLSGGWKCGHNMHELGIAITKDERDFSLTFLDAQIDPGVPFGRARLPQSSARERINPALRIPNLLIGQVTHRNLHNIFLELSHKRITTPLTQERVITAICAKAFIVPQFYDKEQKLSYAAQNGPVCIVKTVNNFLKSESDRLLLFAIKAVSLLELYESEAKDPGTEQKLQDAIEKFVNRREKILRSYSETQIQSFVKESDWKKLNLLVDSRLHN